MIFPGLASEHLSKEGDCQFYLSLSLAWRIRSNCLNGFNNFFLTRQHHQIRFYLVADLTYRLTFITTTAK